MSKKITLFKSFMIVMPILISNGCDNNKNNYNYSNCRGKPYSNKIAYHKKYNKQNPKDINFKKQIYGKWKKILKQKDGSLLFVTTNFYRNGKFYISAIRKKDNTTISKLYSKGNWYIKNSYLIEKTKNSNYATLNSITKDKIIIITNKQFVYKTQNGKIFTYYKK